MEFCQSEKVGTLYEGMLEHYRSFPDRRITMTISLHFNMVRSD